MSEGYLRSVMRRGCRPNTRLAYSYELNDFGRFLERAGVESLGQLNRQHIEVWQDELCLRKKPRTQGVAATAVKELLLWAADQELPLSSANLWMRVAQPRLPKLRPRPIPRNDLFRICERLGLPPSNLVDLRIRALFWLILASGARISEAISLDRGQADRTMTVIQKGGDEHVLVLSPFALTTVNDYLAARRDSSPAMFFLHRPDRPFARLNKKWSQRGWDDLCRTLGISRFTSHQIRHSCATEMLRRHVDGLVIAKHMGHASLATLQGYAEVDLDERFLAVDGLDQQMAATYAEHRSA